MLSQCIGTDRNYFGANCLLEIGNNYLKAKEYQTATAFLYQASEILEAVFNDQHPIMQKYYAYAIEVAGAMNKNEDMMQLALKQKDLIDKTNVTLSSKPSIFVLDGLLTLVSVQCQADSANTEILLTIK